MESVCIAALQPAPSPAFALCYTSSSSLQSFVSAGISAGILSCSSLGARTESIRLPPGYLGGERLCEKTVSHGGALFSSRKIPGIGGGPKNCFSPRVDVELADAEAQDVNVENAGLVHWTDVRGVKEIFPGEVSAASYKIWQKCTQGCKLMVTRAMAFVMCNLVSVNMSIVIIPITRQLAWSSSREYAISQLPHGFLAGRYPGKAMSVFERSGAVSFAFGGPKEGIVAGLLLVPAIFKLFDWDVGMSLFGILGICCCLGFDIAKIGGGRKESSALKAGSAGNQTRGDTGPHVKSAHSSENSDPCATSLNLPDEVLGKPNIPCDSCKGRGWLVCDFCEGQKVNVQSRNNRIYRRCPNCRAAGVVICPQCKVFKCVSFPDEKDDGTEA